MIGKLFVSSGDPRQTSPGALQLGEQDNLLSFGAMPNIASRISQLTGEGALAVFSRAKELERKGRSIIHLELGEPDFHPAAPVVDALRAAVAAGRSASTTGAAG